MSKPVGHQTTRKPAGKVKAAKPTRRQAPARTVEAREKQLVNLAVTVAEEQLSNRTASSQVITHYLKLGTTLYELEREKLKNENLLLAAKTESLKSAKEVTKLYSEALAAFRAYSGQPPQPSEEDDEDD